VDEDAKLAESIKFVLSLLPIKRRARSLSPQAPAKLSFQVHSGHGPNVSSHGREHGP